MSPYEYYGYEPYRKNFKKRFFIGLIIISLATGNMIVQEHIIIRKAADKVAKSMKAGRRAGRRIKSFFEL